MIPGQRPFRPALIFLFGFAVLSGNGCGGGRNKSEKTPVRLVMSSQIYTLLPVILAQSLAYYEEEGLAVHIEDIQSNTRAVHALIGGSAEVSTGTLTQVLSLAAEGRDVKAFLTVMVQSQGVLVASPGWATKIRTIGDLRGAPVGVGGLGGPSNMALNWILSQNGVPPSDVTLVNIGTLATAVAAVERGKVAAAILNDVEYVMLRKRGVDPVLLADTRGRENTKRVFGVEEYPITVLVSTGEWLRKNPDTARRLARAMKRSLQWMHQQSPASVIDQFPPQYRGDPQIDFEVTSALLPMFSGTGRMSREGAEAIRRVAAVSAPALRSSTFDLSKTYTNEFVGEN
jgi:NitT/TauT family transport system substrate-binding protein